MRFHTCCPYPPSTPPSPSCTAVLRLAAPPKHSAARIRLGRASPCHPSAGRGGTEPSVQHWSRLAPLPTPVTSGTTL
eukprot:364805-Chlamydomonas_euryale.AAC.3